MQTIKQLRILELEEALKPFADYASLSSFQYLNDDYAITSDRDSQQGRSKQKISKKQNLFMTKEFNN